MPIHDQEHPTWSRTEDLDGKVWIVAKSHAALVANTPYALIIDEAGWVTAALPAAAKDIYVGVPAAAVAGAGEFVRMQIGGRVTAMVTPSLSVSVGHGLTVNTAAVADIGADFSGAAGEFAACVTESTASTTQDVVLIPERITTI